jgi:HEAT repeat protein
MSRAQSFGRALAVAGLLHGGLAVAVTRATVQSRLQYVDGFIPSAADWRRLGDGVDVELGRIAQDGSLLHIVRIRAIAGLGQVGGGNAQRLLVDDHHLAPALTAAACLAYAGAFRAAEPVEVLKRTRALLNHPDWMVRRAAVRALGDWKTSAALEALREHSAVEDHPVVRLALDRALPLSP